MASRNIIVIGAGISGLTAAFRLQQAGHQVRVLESGSQVGGRMITIHWQGLAIDPGAEFVTGADRYLLEMVRQLKIEDKLIDYSDQQTGFNVSVMRDGKIHPVNFMSISSYMGWTAVSLRARLSMLKLLPYMIQAGRQDIFQPEIGYGDDTITMEEFFQQKINSEMFEYWVEPMMDVFCGYTPKDLSAKMLLKMFGSYLSKKLFTFEGGIGFLPNKLASQLQVTCQAQVQHIKPYPDGIGVNIHYQHQGRLKKTDADLVVLAVPGDIVPELLADMRPIWQSFFSFVRYTQVGIVYHLLVGDEPIFDEGGIMFPRKEPWKLAALGWKRRPDGRVLAMSDLKAHLYNPSISDEELRKAITAEVVRVIPVFEKRIRDQMVFRWERKVPIFPPGYLTALQAFKQDIQKGPIFFCGDYLIGPTAGSALASGWKCADQILTLT